MKYYVDYEEGGAKKQDKFLDCKDAGMAFALCQKAHPLGRKLIRLAGCCIAEALSGITGLGAHIDYDPVPVQRDPIKEPRPARAPKKAEREGVMPFFDESESYRVYDSGKMLALPPGRSPNN